MWIDLCEPLTKKSESCVLSAYWDKYGKVWTVGYGATGPGIMQGVIWTQDHADTDLRSRLLGLGAFIDASVKTALNDYQKAALVDFVYNVGEGNFRGSTMLKLLNEGRDGDTALEFPKWNHAGGVVLAGLTTRREAEKSLFLTSMGEPQPQIAAQPRRTLWTLLQSLLALFRSSRTS